MAATDSDGNGNSTSPSGAYKRLPRRTLFGWGFCETGLPGWYFARSDSRLYASNSYCILCDNCFIPVNECSRIATRNCSVV